MQTVSKQFRQTRRDQEASDEDLAEAETGKIILSEVLRSRRQRLFKLINFPVLLWSGSAKPRNFAANIYPFRASSHFLYSACIMEQHTWKDTAKLQVQMNLVCSQLLRLSPPHK